MSINQKAKEANILEVEEANYLIYNHLNAMCLICQVSQKQLAKDIGIDISIFNHKIKHYKASIMGKEYTYKIKTPEAFCILYMLIHKYGLVIYRGEDDTYIFSKLYSVEVKR